MPRTKPLSLAPELAGNFHVTLQQCGSDRPPRRRRRDRDRDRDPPQHPSSGPTENRRARSGAARGATRAGRRAQGSKRAALAPCLANSAPRRGCLTSGEGKEEREGGAGEARPGLLDRFSLLVSLRLRARSLSCFFSFFPSFLPASTPHPTPALLPGKPRPRRGAPSRPLSLSPSLLLSLLRSRRRRPHLGAGGERRPLRSAPRPSAPPAGRRGGLLRARWPGGIFLRESGGSSLAAARLRLREGSHAAPAHRLAAGVGCGSGGAPSLPPPACRAGSREQPGQRAEGSPLSPLVSKGAALQVRGSSICLTTMAQLPSDRLLLNG